MYKRDFSAPTLEDHFNKTILPKVMQVGVLAGGHLACVPCRGVVVPQRGQELACWVGANRRPPRPP